MGRYRKIWTGRISSSGYGLASVHIPDLPKDDYRVHINVTLDSGSPDPGRQIIIMMTVDEARARAADLLRAAERAEALIKAHQGKGER